MSTDTLLPYRFPQDACVALIEGGPDARLSPDAPALAVMTDLLQVTAALVPPQCTLPEAERRMAESRVQMLFVTERMPCVEGIITLSMLRGDRPLRVAHENRLHFDAITVSEVMATLPECDVLDFERVRRATLCDLARAFLACGSTHLLVVESAGALGRIRGVISHTRLQRVLGTGLPLLKQANSFAELARALA
jgi:hypothetical protein